ncbi:unnamed protein product, partial [marine sediment metagenome]
LWVWFGLSIASNCMFGYFAAYYEWLANPGFSQM